MAKDIERGELFSAGVSRGRVPRHEHGPKIYPEGGHGSKNYNLFLDAVCPALLYWVRGMGSHLP
jgi:hypothetical protein